VPDSPAPSGLPAGSPGHGGGFTLTGTRSEDPLGGVYTAVGADGRRALVVVLGAGPSGDAAARDRFAAAVAERVRRGGLLAAGTGADRPWAALDAGRAESSAAQAILDAVLPAAPVGAVPRGPGFEPHWSGRPPVPWHREPAALAAPPAGEDAGRRTTWWVVAAVAAVVAMVLAGIVGWRLVVGSGADGSALADPAPLGTPTTAAPSPDGGVPPGPSTPRPTGPAPSAQPPSTQLPSTQPPSGQPPSGQPPSGQPTPDRPLETSGPGVSGPSFLPDEQTRELRLAGLPFPFRVPATWGCLRSSSVEEPLVRWVCLDERWLAEGRAGAPPGGVVEVRPCRAGCPATEWSALRELYGDGDRWEAVDATTALIEDTAPGAPGSYRIRMSHLFSSEGTAGQTDLHVFVRLSGPAEQTELLQKVVNDIRANTP
jgi:hypothetical protein